MLFNKKMSGSVTLHGLTEEQCMLLDTMWHFETEDEIMDWKSELSLRQRRLADSLLLCVLLEHLDKFAVKSEDYNDAREVLKHYTLR